MFQQFLLNINCTLYALRQLFNFKLIFKYFISYRGYGESQGNPSEKGIQKDGETMMKHILESTEEEINKKDIYIYGRSLGGAVAIYVASKFRHEVIQFNLNSMRKIKFRLMV